MIPRASGYWTNQGNPGAPSLAKALDSGPRLRLTPQVFASHKTQPYSKPGEGSLAQHAGVVPGPEGQRDVAPGPQAEPQDAKPPEPGGSLLKNEPVS